MSPSGLAIAPLLLQLLLVVDARADSGKNADNSSAGCGRFLNYKFFLGNKTDFDDYPWLVLLEYDTPKGRLAACGGALISERHVLTAAHCVANLGGNWSLSSVRVGEYDTSTALDCLPEGDPANSTHCVPAAFSVPIASSSVHEAYGKKSRSHDLAVLTLAENITFSELVWSICLPSSEPQPQRFHVAGWGRLAGRPGTGPKFRSYASLGNGSVCADWYRMEKVNLAEDQFCAGGVDNEKVCVADSGGPLMGVEKMADGSYKMAVFGLLTVDSRFCQASHWPGVYTDVLKYRDWILQQTARNSS